MNGTVEYYRAFYNVARCGSISRAARQMLSNQPNLSRMIKLLESEVGCTLFQRTNRGVRLTSEGERLYAHVKIAFEQLEAGESELNARHNLEQGEIVIAASMVALRCVLVNVLKRFRKQYPRIRVRIQNAATPQAVSEVRDGKVDLAVVTAPSYVPDALKKTMICTVRDVAVCGNGFESLSGTSVSLEELSRFPMLSLDAQTKTFETYSCFYASKGLCFQPDMEVSDIEQLLQMAEANLGVCFLPEPFVKASGRLNIIHLKEKLPEREICLLRRAHLPGSIVSEAFEKMIAENRD